MNEGKDERLNLSFVNAWNQIHKPGLKVIVETDTGPKDSITTSAAFMLGKTDTYIGHSAVIMLQGFTGCYDLHRVRPATKEYLVKWTIQIFDARTPEEAAQKALEIQRDSNSRAVCFEVRDQITKKIVKVDLDETFQEEANKTIFQPQKP